LAGNKILKTLRIDNDNSCVEEYDVRDAASRTRDTIAAQRDTFEIEDVAWSRDGFSDYIATAARNGKIVLYNIARPDVQIGRLHDHLQQVHKVDFSPIEGGSLLSASQDGTVRLWDLRMLEHNSMFCSSRTTYNGRSDSVRHAKWSPTDTWSFAFCTDSGIIQKWDIRNNSTPLMKFAAHYQTCNSIAWHPDGKHLVSAGKDQDVNVWNMQGEGHRQRPVFTFKAPYPVQTVRWRSPCFVQDSQDQTYKQCTHLATAYQASPVIHIWDLRRPLIPFKEVHQQINNGTNDMLWRTKDLLLSVGGNGEFSQTDVGYAPKTIDRRAMSTLACSPDGELNFYVKPRPSRDRSESLEEQREIVPHSNGDMSTDEKLSLGRSPGDDSFEEKFLTPTLLSSHKHHSRTPSVRSAKSFGTTPPTTDETNKITMIDFDLALARYSSQDGGQIAKYGLLLGTKPPLDTTFLAQKYKGPSVDLDLDVAYVQGLPTMFEQNCDYAQRASRYRDGQTWRIFGTQLNKELQHRGKHNRQKRLDALLASKKEDSHVNGRSRATSLMIPHSRSSNAVSPSISAVEDKASTGDSRSTQDASRSISPVLMRKPIRRPLSRLNSSSTINSKALPETTSIETTPVLRPLRGGMADGPELSLITRDVAQQPNVFLPLTESTALPVLHENVASLPIQISPINSEAQTTRVRTLHGRRPFSLEEPHDAEPHGDVRQPSRGRRQDSAESFEMFSTSTDSEPHLSPPAPLVGLPDEDYFRTRLSMPDIRHNSNERDDEPEEGSPTSHSGPGIPVPRPSSRLVRRPTEEPLHDLDIRNPKQRWSGNDTDDRRLDHAHKDNVHATSNIPRSVSEPGLDNRKLSECQDSTQAEPEPQPDQPVAKVFVPGNRPKVTRLVQDESKKEEKGHNDGTTDENDYLISDFLDNPSSAPSKPNNFVNATIMLQELLVWYIDHNDAQMAANLFLLASPFLATNPSSDRNTNNEILDATYHDVLTSQFLAFTPEAADDIITTHHRPLDTIGISAICAESVLATYHDQLLVLDTLNPAAQLRNLAYPAFPSVYEQGLKDVEIGYLCTACNSAINNPWNKFHCETCGAYQDVCPICAGRESPFELPGGKKKKVTDKAQIGSPIAMPDARSFPVTAAVASTPDPRQALASFTSTSSSSFPTANANADAGHDTTCSSATSLTPHSLRTLFTTCPLCNHAAHSACAAVWFADPSSYGGCPMEGCTCDCTRGRYRDERLAAMQREESEKAKGRADGKTERGLGKQRAGAAGAVHEDGVTRSFEAKTVRMVVPGGSAEV